MDSWKSDSEQPEGQKSSFVLLSFWILLKFLSVRAFTQESENAHFKYMESIYHGVGYWSVQF